MENKASVWKFENSYVTSVTGKHGLHHDLHVNENGILPYCGKGERNVTFYPYLNTGYNEITNTRKDGLSHDGMRDHYRTNDWIEVMVSITWRGGPIDHKEPYFNWGKTFEGKKMRDLLKKFKSGPGSNNCYFFSEPEKVAQYLNVEVPEIPKPVVEKRGIKVPLFFVAKGDDELLEGLIDRGWDWNQTFSY